LPVEQREQPPVVPAELVIDVDARAEFRVEVFEVQPGWLDDVRVRVEDRLSLVHGPLRFPSTARARARYRGFFVV
jgi:hypothetical protein